MTKMKRLLLLGCGDIPQRLLRRLDLQRWQVTAMRRSELQLPGITTLRGDVNQPASVATALECMPQQVLVTLSPDSRGEDSYRTAYLQPLQTLVTQLQSSQLNPRITLVSSTSVYPQNQGQWVDEHSPAGGSSDTSRVLHEAEQCLLQSQYDATVVRFSGIYGPGRDRLINRVRAGEFSSANRWTNRIHSEDCAGALKFLLEQVEQLDNKQLVLASDCSPVNSCEVESWLARELGVMHPGKLPDPVVGKRCRNDHLVQMGYHFLHPDFRSGYRAMLDGQRGL